MTAPAGWYNDGAGLMRWWDGTAWTTNTAPIESTAVGTDVEELPQPSVPTAPEPFAPPYVGPVSSAPFGSAPAPSFGTAPQLPATTTTPPKLKFGIIGVIGLAVSVVGFVLAWIPAITPLAAIITTAGLVLSVVSLFFRAKKWPGIAGIAVGVVGTIVVIVVILVSFTSQIVQSIPGLDDPTDDAPASPAVPLPDSAEMVGISELKVGDCLPYVEWEESVYEVPVVPCEELHTDEVYLVFVVPSGEYPGDEALNTLAIERCEAEFEGFIGIAWEESQYDYYWYTPTETSWNELEDRTVQCIVFDFNNVRGSLKGTAR